MKATLRIAIVFVLSLTLDGSAQNKSTIDSLLKVIDQPIHDTVKVIALGELSWELHFYNRDSALLFAQRELALAEKNDFTKGIGLGHFDLGTAESYAGAYLKAIRHYQNAIYYFKKARKKHLEGLCYYNIAVAYSRHEVSDKAISYFLQALDILKEREDWVHVAQTYTGIANNYATLKDFEKAVRYHDQAVRIAEEKRESLAIALSDYSTMYDAMLTSLHQSRYLDSSLVYLVKVRSLVDSGAVQNPVMRPAVLHNMGNIFYQQGKHELAKQYITQAMALAKPINLVSAIAEGNILLGKIYTAFGDRNMARRYLTEALPLAETVSAQHVLNCYEALLALAKIDGKLTEALVFQEKVMTLKDSLYNINKAEVAEKLAVVYETATKEARIEALEKENLSERRLGRLYAIFAVLSLLLAILIFCLFRLKHKILQQREALLKETQDKAALQEQLSKQQQEQLSDALKHQETINHLQQLHFRKEIDYKERELTTTVTLLEQQNSFLETLKNDLGAFISSSKTSGDLKKIYNTVERQLASGQDFENFLLHFEKVHPQFFKRLEAYSPASLTMTEQKLSAYIRMKLSTKEIAHLMNVEPKSIQMARYRLKQKLAIDQDKDLVTFIQEL
jgi:tetratricopeptide (TPR) repeat protein